MRYEGSLKKLEEKCERENLELRIVNYNELFIDLDNVDDLIPFLRKLRLVHRLFKPVLSAFKRRSRSGKGWHIRVVMSVPLEIRERCALHLACGSDPTRELLRLRSIHNGTEDQTSAFCEARHTAEEPLLIMFPASTFEDAIDTEIATKPPTEGVQDVVTTNQL